MEKADSRFKSRNQGEACWRRWEDKPPLQPEVLERWQPDADPVTRFSWTCWKCRGWNHQSHLSHLCSISNSQGAAPSPHTW